MFLLQLQVRCHFAFVLVLALSIQAEVRAFSKISLGQCTHLFVTKPTSAQFDYEALVRDYLRLDFFGIQPKKDFVDYAQRNQRVDNVVFIDIENALLKVLNDFTSDKTLITSLTNLHKKMLGDAFIELLSSSPDIESLTYSDFKSMRFAFRLKSNSKVDLENFQKSMQSLFAQINLEYVFALEKLGLNIMNSAKYWFRGGLGLTADEANIAARAAREDKSENKLFNFSDLRLRESLWSWQKSAELKRKDLFKSLGRTPIFAGDGFLKVGAIDIVRKSKTNSELIGRVHRKYRIKLEVYQAEKLKMYVNDVDRFTPGLYSVERRIASLEKARFGGLSADFAGLGARNIDATARAIAKAKDIDDLLVQVRISEGIVTTEFQTLLYEFDKVLKEYYEIRIPSGDDFIAYSERPLTRNEKLEILQKLAALGLASGIRLAFIGEGVSDSQNGLSHRGLLGAHGESIEKDLRVALEGKVEDRVLADLTFAINMQGTQAGQGNVQLWIGQGGRIGISDHDLKVIEQQFQSVVAKFNEKVEQPIVAKKYKSNSIQMTLMQLGPG